jgi:DNA-binding transcriptional MerR regulator
MPADRITTGKFSGLTYLSQKALRLYDSRGILVPEVRDRFTGYRYYTVSQVETALKIRTLCTLGFGLSEISEIMSALSAGDDETVRRLIDIRHRETMAEIERLEKIQSLLMERRDFSELFAMNVSEPVIKEVPAMRIISGRRTGTYEEVCSKVSEDLFGKPEERCCDHRPLHVVMP